MDILRTFIVGFLTAAVLNGLLILIKFIVTGFVLLNCSVGENTKREFVYLGRKYDADKYIKIYKMSLRNKSLEQERNLLKKYEKKLSKRPDNSLYKLRIEAIRYVE